MFRLKKPRIHSSVYILVKEHAFVLCVPSVNNIINKMDVSKYFRSFALLWILMTMKPPAEEIQSSTKQRNMR